MAPSAPKIVIYYQKHFINENPDHKPFGALIPVQPLVGYITHLNVSSIHINEIGNQKDKDINDNPTDYPPVTLNDTAWDSDELSELWEETAKMQKADVKVLGMLGGWDAGWPGGAPKTKRSYALLEQDFDTYYPLLFNMLKSKNIDGLDIDVEERIDLDVIQKLILRLKQDFGSNFIITLAPVSDALQIPNDDNLSGFNYFDLEKAVGKDITQYNVQFYGPSTALSVDEYNKIISAPGALWRPERVIAGVLTSADNPATPPDNYVPFEALKEHVLPSILEMYGPKFGGVSGWEYWGSDPNGKSQPAAPEQWAKQIRATFSSH